jgi:hypothetical protein
MDENTAQNCRNVSDVPSVSLTANIWRGGNPGLPAQVPGGITSELLANGAPVMLPTLPATLTLQRLLVPAGEALVLPPSGVLLLFVEAGAVAVTPGATGATINRDTGSSTEQAAPAAVVELAALDGAMLELDDSTVTNAGERDATVLVMTLTPTP